MKVIKINAEQTISVRHDVLWPNELPEYCRVEGDDDAEHFGVAIDEKIVCVASIYIKKETARLRKFATLPVFQGRGIGSYILKYIVNELKSQGISYLWFDARESALIFYTRLGFTCTGERFYKNEVPYYKMHAYL